VGARHRQNRTSCPGGPAGNDRLVEMKAGARAAAHQHPHEQIVWMLKGKMDFRIGNDRRSMIAGDVAVIPGNTEHEGIFPEDTEVIDIFTPPREDFLAGGVPAYMRRS
jgi:quercetin dioxygenase-like cupin family protein